MIEGGGKTEPVLWASPAARRAASLVFAFWILSIIAWNVPDFSLQNRWRSLSRPVYETLNLDVSWSFFAPYPNGESRVMWAAVRTEAGRTIRVDMPGDNSLMGEYRHVRWTRFASQAHYNDELAQVFGRWAASQVEDAVLVEVWVDEERSPSSRSGPVVRERAQRMLIEVPLR